MAAHTKFKKKKFLIFSYMLSKINCHSLVENGINAMIQNLRMGC